MRHLTEERLFLSDDPPYNKNMRLITISSLFRPQRKKFLSQTQELALPDLNEREGASTRTIEKVGKEEKKKRQGQEEKGHYRPLKAQGHC